jgi:hypothetical protein
MSDSPPLARKDPPELLLANSHGAATINDVSSEAVSQNIGVDDDIHQPKKQKLSHDDNSDDNGGDLKPSANKSDKGPDPPLPLAPTLEEYLSNDGHLKYAPRPEWCRPLIPTSRTDGTEYYARPSSSRPHFPVARDRRQAFGPLAHLLGLGPHPGRAVQRSFTLNDVENMQREIDEDVNRFEDLLRVNDVVENMQRGIDEDVNRFEDLLRVNNVGLNQEVVGFMVPPPNVAEEAEVEEAALEEDEVEAARRMHQMLRSTFSVNQNADGREQDQPALQETSRDFHADPDNARRMMDDAASRAAIEALQGEEDSAEAQRQYVANSYLRLSGRGPQWRPEDTAVTKRTEGPESNSVPTNRVSE